MSSSRFSRQLKALTDNLVALVANGWMSGSYTGALLTEGCQLVADKPEKNAQHSL